MSPPLTRLSPHEEGLQCPATILLNMFRSIHKRNGGICLKHRDDRPYYVFLTTLVRFLEFYDVIVW